MLAAGKAARELDRARLDQRVRFAPRFGDGSEPAGALERLLGTAELCQQEGAVAFKYGRRLGEAALLAEGDPLLEGGKRAGRPLERVAGEREVVLQDRRVPARPSFDEQGERPLHLGESVRFAAPDAGVPTVAERARRLRQAERLGQRAGMVGGGDRLRVGAADRVRARQLPVGINERRPRLLRLEQVDRFGGERDPHAAVAEAEGDTRAKLERPGGGFRLAAVP